MNNQPTSYTKSRFTTAVLYFDLALIALLVVGVFSKLDYIFLDALLVAILVCHFILYPVAVILERKQLLTKDIIIFVLSFVAFDLAICYPWARSFYHYAPITPNQGRAIKDVLKILHGLGQLLTFFTLLYNLYVWHRIANKRPAAKRFALILWPRQMLVIAQIVLLGIPL